MISYIEIKEGKTGSSMQHIRVRLEMLLQFELEN
jgi:hypothetical protein